MIKIYKDHEEVVNQHLISLSPSSPEAVKHEIKVKSEDYIFSLAAGLKLHLAGDAEGVQVIHKSAKNLGWHFYAFKHLMDHNSRSPCADDSEVVIRDLISRFNYRDAAKYLEKTANILGPVAVRLRAEISKRLLECGDDGYLESLKWGFSESDSQRDRSYIEANYDSVWFGKIREEITGGRGLKLLALAFQRMEKDPADEISRKIMRFKNYSIRYFLYGRRVAFQANPEDSEILLALVECLCVYKLHDEAYSILKKCIVEHLVYSLASHKIKKSLYYVFLKLEDTFERQSRKGPLVPGLIAQHGGLFECYGFDILGLASRSLWDGRHEDYDFYKSELLTSFGDSSYSVVDILTSVESVVAKDHRRSHSVATLISGQIRGLGAVSKNIKKSSAYSDVHMSTWDVEGVMSTQLFDISRIFAKIHFDAVPTELASKNEFEKYFPLTIGKIDAQAPKIKSIATREGILSHFEFKSVDIESDSDFSLQLNGQPHLMAKGNFNQAKMFYKIFRAFSVVMDDSYDVLIRRRSDLTIDINDSVLNYCLAECRKHKNLIYVPYHTVYGCSDQFAIGSFGAMKIYSSIWECIQEKGFRYSDLFNELSVNGAELLVANHLYVHGITVKLIPTLESGLSSARVASEVIDVSEELISDYEALDYNGRSIFKPFMNSFA